MNGSAPSFDSKIKIALGEILSIYKEYQDRKEYQDHRENQDHKGPREIHAGD
jgi:hypothetical protein